ncbi:TetR/AcrR family transcriptional regulator [Thalassoroseus pseudoceratinae]|uniref:TetR/AcrR family transcriptional regulator n=1 Tax=Thalassoroseus pseudoceratinae TaxID=2713176 RepID=UPI00141E2DBD|nr:TetR/AcrR family transcriptional regulator [Thalassoroseus pseudoceratinae]
MARPQRVSDEEILKTARKIFLEHGPKVSVDVIADRLGVSAQAVYKRFSTKQELLLECLRPPGVPQWTEELNAGPTDEPLAEQLTHVVTVISRFFVEMSARMAVLHWSGISEKDIFAHYDPPPPVIGIRALAGWLKKAHERGLIRDVDTEATAIALLGSLHAPVHLERIVGLKVIDHSPEEYVEQVVSVYLQGLHPSSN